ncbi:hypothetical protein ROS1_59030 [Roseibium sp. ROS1]
MDRANIVVGVITGLDMMTEPRFDFMYGGVRVCDARHSARRVPNLFNDTRKLRNNHARLSASRTSGQHQVVSAPDGGTLFVGQSHSSSHRAASPRYFGIVDA